MRAPSGTLPILLFCRLTLSACGTERGYDDDALADETPVPADIVFQTMNCDDAEAARRNHALNLSRKVEATPQGFVSCIEAPAQVETKLGGI